MNILVSGTRVDQLLPKILKITLLHVQSSQLEICFLNTICTCTPTWAMVSEMGVRTDTYLMAADTNDNQLIYSIS